MNTEAFHPGQLKPGDMVGSSPRPWLEERGAWVQRLGVRAPRARTGAW